MEMKRNLLLLIGLCMAVCVQAQKKNFSYKFYGQVRGDLFYNSRANAEIVDGLFHLYPKDVALDADGKDLNASPNGSFYLLYSRLGIDVQGPKVGSAKTSLKLEADFRGSGSNWAVLRIRHAYVNLDWGKSAVLIGLEAEKQMEMAGEYPDVVIGCFGGGSNFSGITFPFLRHKLTEGKDIRVIAAEPASCPKLTRGQFQYDFGDEAGYTPLIPMFTLGHNFSPANIHAGGLRYHGAGSIVSQLMKDELMSAVDIKQLDTFKAATLFAQAEGIIPAPESSHAIAAAIHEAEQAKIEGKPRTILFNLSGHGLIDMAAYDQYLSGDLTNYEVTDEEVANNLKDLEKII
jgi:hypothetical protein